MLKSLFLHLRMFLQDKGISLIVANFHLNLNTNSHLDKLFQQLQLPRLYTNYLHYKADNQLDHQLSCLCCQNMYQKDIFLEQKLDELIKFQMRLLHTVKIPRYRLHHYYREHMQIIQQFKVLHFWIQSLRCKSTVYLRFRDRLFQLCILCMLKICLLTILQGYKVTSFELFLPSNLLELQEVCGRLTVTNSLRYLKKLYRV